MIKTILFSTFFYFLSFSSSADEDVMDKILKDPEVKKAYDDCEKKGGSADIGTCIWSKFQANPEKQEQLKKMVQKDSLDSQKGSDEKIKSTQIESVSHNLKVKLKGPEDKAFSKLHEYLSKRIRDTIYKDIDGQHVQMVNHDIFYRMYESMIGKNIIRATSSYCIETKVDKSKLKESLLFPVIPEKADERKKAREENIKSLSNVTMVKDWQFCIKGISNTCYKLDDVKNKNKSHSKEDYEYSKTRACQITTYLKRMRSDLQNLEKIKTALNKANKDPSASLINNVKVYRGQKEGSKGKNLEDLVSISSNEFSNKSKFSDEMKGVMSEFERCVDPDSNTIKDEKSCQQYLFKKQKDQDEASLEVAKYALRTKINEQRMENLSDEDLQSHLKDHGYDEKIADISKLSDVEKDKIKKEVKDRYAAEREALVKSFEEKFKSKKTKKAGAFDKSTDTLTTKGLEEVSKSLAEKTDEYKALIHFDNIVSAFLSVESAGGKGKKGESSSNFASARRELDDSAFDPNNAEKDRQPGQQNPTQQSAVNFDRLKENLEKSDEAKSFSKTKEEDPSSDDGDKNLGVNVINKLVGFDQFKEKDEKESDNKQGQNSP